MKTHPKPFSIFDVRLLASLGTRFGRLSAFGLETIGRYRATLPFGAAAPNRKSRIQNPKFLPLPLALLFALALPPLAAPARPAIEISPADTPADSQTDLVELPRYTVTDTRILPPPESWRHATLPGFEILSNAYDITTRSFLKDFQQLQAAIAIVWPSLTIHKAGTPTLLILCARNNAFTQFIPDGDSDVFITPTSLFVEDKERGAIVIDFTMQEAFNNAFDTIETPGILIPADFDGTADDAANAPTTATTLTSNDPYGQFYRQYARFLMRRANNNIPIPDWLEEGLSQLFTTLDFRKKWIEFGKVEHGFGENDAAPRSVADTAKSGDLSSTADRRTRFGHIMPLGTMFNPDPAKLSDTNWRAQWKKQCFAFTHMCLYGMNKKYQKPFINFALKACAGPVDETDFKKHFNQTHKQMATRLAAHVDTVAQQSVLFKAKRGAPGLPDPLPVELREATQPEIGRIKGEVLRLAGHAAASREALIIPYLRKERDPGLLASLGLLETLENRTDRARKFLEAAAKENAIRPRAYAELARLRLDEALAAPAAPGGRLSPAQTAAVLDPLFKARDQPPPMEDVYILIGRAWLHSAATPGPLHLGALLEGTAHFPNNIIILEQAATLYALHGDKPTATTLINLGLALSPDQPTREKFKSLTP
jgi:hypothetical protein